MRTTISLLILSLAAGSVAGDERAIERQFVELQPVLREFCWECHSAEASEGDLDLQRFTSVEQVRKDVQSWRAMIVQLETGEMPPRDQPQPSETQRNKLIQWTRAFLDSEARARAGDPGYVPLHRLSNTEYDNTIRDLTGVDLRPTRDFPADGAAGEGFTNAAEALSMSPALMGKYVSAAKSISDHAVLLPDGFRFSKSATQRDQTDQSVALLRKFYRQFTVEGSLPLKPYIEALINNRQRLDAGTVSLEQVAKDNAVSLKYLSMLWRLLNDESASYPLNRVRLLWRHAGSDDVDGIVAEVSSWFDRLWEYPRIGSYVNEHRQKPIDPAVAESQTISIAIQPEPGQADVQLHLIARNLVVLRDDAVFFNPRFTADGRPTLKLCDYNDFGPQYEIDFAKVFEKTEMYLSAAVELADQAELTTQQIAAKYKIDSDWFAKWITVLDVRPIGRDIPPPLGRTVSPIEMSLLDELAPNPQFNAVNGWRPKGTDLPIVIANSSDNTEHVPGRISAHGIAVHPIPEEFVAVVWKSPVNGRVRVNGRVAHAHPACGNGVAWWVECQTSSRSTVIAEGAVDLGKETTISELTIEVAKGDRILLAIDARDASHVCDLTETELTITEATETEPRVWDLAADVSGDITTGNPHKDRLGNADVWSFVRGSSKDRPRDTTSQADTNSVLVRWRRSVSASQSQAETGKFAKQLKDLLSGTRPPESDLSNRELYDRLLAFDGPLLSGMNFRRLHSSTASDFGLPPERFNGDNLVVKTDKAMTVRVPAALFKEYQFQVDCKAAPLASDAPESGKVMSGAMQFQVLAQTPTNEVTWDTTAPIIADEDGRQRLLDGLAEFRRVFPPNVCYPHIIPLDEVVCLKTFHREDQPLIDLFLNHDQAAELDRLWREHRFISKFPIVEYEYLPLFIGFVTQDQPKELLKLFEDKRPTFQGWADEFNRDFENAAPNQFQQLFEFASNAYRRPLRDGEANELKSLYESLRASGAPHEEAFRSLIARLLISPSFLLHLEHAPQGIDPALVNDWELASRLSYFLWSSMPDEELRTLAATGRLHDPQTLAGQVKRMLNDDRVRSLAIEFGTQMIHVREFDKFSEKNEKLFPEFDTALRTAMYEESVLFFQDMFQNDRSADKIIDADYTFLNELLASHYGIPEVKGEQWRRVDGVQDFGRGGVIGLASVQTRQAGASRTSPILRGNWLVETMLGDKLPLPPPNVPPFPQSDLDNDTLSMRHIVAKHVSDPQCASCHQRIDPFGLAFERFDPIGRLREHDTSGIPIDALAKLRDGTEFTGIDGLRRYLRTNKHEQIVRVFYKRLLGYALGRSTSLSDQLLIDKMMKATNDGSDGVTQAIVTIVDSPQFRKIRGREK